MKMVPLTRSMAETARLWRNECLEAMRTPFPLMEEQQQEFYLSLQDRDCLHRYFGFIVEPNVHIGMGGITNIQWENRLGEISLIIAPEHRRFGWGKDAAYMLYAYAFDVLNLETVYGEAYLTRPTAEKFWVNLFPQMYRTYLPNRKYWDGQYWPSVYFSIFLPEYKTWQALKK